MANIGKNPKIGETQRLKYGVTEDGKSKHHVMIGSQGGKNGNTGGFASNKVGADGLTGKQRAAIVGAKGGSISRRGSKND